MIRDECMLHEALPREQFGQPSSEFEQLAAMLADSKTEIYAALSMVLDASKRRDRGENVSTEASCCKMLASEMRSRLADRAMQIRGGPGYMAECPVQRFYRDMRLFRLHEDKAAQTGKTLHFLLGAVVFLPTRSINLVA